MGQSQKPSPPLIPVQPRSTQEVRAPFYFLEGDLGPFFHQQLNHPNLPISTTVCLLSPKDIAYTPSALYAFFFAGLIGCLQLLVHCILPLCHSFNSGESILIIFPFARLVEVIERDATSHDT
jgi:hypothetical protein